jgi:sensor histidine kinase YesM
MKKNSLLVVTVVGTVLMLLYQPVCDFFSNHDIEQAFKTLGWATLFFLPFLLVYLVNHFFLIQKYIFKEKNTKKFWFVNLIVFLFVYALKMSIRKFMADFEWTEVFLLLLPNITVVYMIIGMSLGIKYYLKSVEDLEKEKENQKAELQWLKNQLNPHFLFNTMNNISSQIYVNPDEAQENLSRLSEVLRYALYETGAERVELYGEIEFMENYIYLMKLRCSDKTTVKIDFPKTASSIKILPLLYISLIENAFKHGVSNKLESFIEISLKINDKKLIFSSINSNFAKTAQNRSGHGIGLENLKRRLDLAYKDKYLFKYGVDSNGNFETRLEVDTSEI